MDFLYKERLLNQMKKQNFKEHSLNDLSDEIFGVIGVCGVVGNLVARVLMDNELKVIGTDIQKEKECQFKYTLEDYNLPLYFGNHPESFFSRSDFIIPPPSLPAKSDLSQKLKNNSAKEEYSILKVEDVLNFITPDKPVLCVTGTNGKTTTVTLLKHICLNAGLKPVEHGFKNLQGNIEYIPPLQCRLNGDVAVLETGTFGNPGDLKFIIERCLPDCGIITNITPDHLHDVQDFLSYAQIKGEFVDYLQNKMLIVNGDDPTVWGLIKSHRNDYKNIITFGVECETNTINKKICWCGRDISLKETISGMGYYSCPCGLKNPQIHYKATDIKENSFILHTTQEVFTVKTPLMGLHNIYNILGAIVAAKEFFNIPMEKILESVESFNGVPGRLDHIGKYKDKEIIIDYAHNPGGVETILKELKKIYKNIAVVISVSSESGEEGDMDILNKSLNIADFVIPASYDSRKAADSFNNSTIKSEKIILTPEYPEKYKIGTLGANLEQLTEGLKTALECPVNAVICIGEAAFKFKEDIQKNII